MGKRVWMRRLFASAAVALSTAGWASFTDEVNMAVEQVWGQGSPSGRVIPIRITVQNDGPDRRGTIEAKGFGVSRTTIDMPRNSLKEVILYPPANNNGYESVEITLTTQGGQIKVPLEAQSMAGDDTTIVVGLISDTVGGFSFLRNSNHKGNKFQDAYLKPGLALDRAVGYEAANLLVIGEGGERLTDREVGALKRYALMGGTLIFMGGASAPVLRDPRWSDTLPIKNPRAVSLPFVEYLRQFGDLPDGSINVTTGDPASRTTFIKQGGTLVAAKRSFGIGTILYLGFNLTEQPLSKWKGRLQMFYTYALEARKSAGVFRSTSSGYSEYVGQTYGDNYWSGSAPRPVTPSGSLSDGDPFRAKLPPTATIAMILFGFWLVVIPIHFFILARLKRGEAAWITAPLIALGFAGLLFTLASGLYKSGLTTALQGVLVRSDQSEEAIFLGRQQLFFPSGGRYDLGLHGVEAILPTSSENFQLPGRSSDTSFQNELKDVGEIIADSATTTNLNFKEYRFAERQTSAWSIPGDLSVRLDGENIIIAGAITNGSPYELKSASVWVDGKSVPLSGSIAPGSTQSIKISTPTKLKSQSEVTVALWAQVEGIKAGSDIGKAAAGRFQELYYSYGSFKLEVE